MHGVAVALDLAGATLDQRRGDFGFRLITARQRAVEAEEEAARARAETEAEIAATLIEGGASKIKRNGYAVQLKTPTDGEAVLEIRSA